MPDFLLKKWYLDYVTLEFDAAIFYRGSLRFGPIEIHHCSELRKTGAIIANEVFWDNKKFSIFEKNGNITCLTPEREAVWSPLEAPIQFTMFEKENKYIRWHCLQPRANVVLGGRGATAAGQG
jgi:hypothetical protein